MKRAASGERKAKTCWVGFDLGGTKMLATVYDDGLRQLGRHRTKSRGFEGAQKGLDRMEQTIREALQEAGVPLRALAGIGVGCPGPVDMGSGVVVEMPNMGWKNVPVAESLRRRFRCPAAVLNDVDAGVYGEYRLGAGRKARCLVGVFPGTGIGGGCVYEGRILRGAARSCMEIGHMPVVPDGPLCGCGRRGCLESLASRLAISAAAAASAYRGEAPHLLELAGGCDVARIRSGTLAKAIARGDRSVERIVRHAARLIGLALAGVVNLLAPDRIVLGGGLVEAMPDLLRTEVESAARKRVMPSFEKTFEVVVAQLGDDATAVGAAAWARELSLGATRS